MPGGGRLVGQRFGAGARGGGALRSLSPPSHLLEGRISLSPPACSSPRRAAPRFCPGASSPLGEACSRSCFPLQGQRGPSRPAPLPALLAGGTQRGQSVSHAGCWGVRRRRASRCSSPGPVTPSRFLPLPASRSRGTPRFLFVGTRSQELCRGPLERRCLGPRWGRPSRPAPLCSRGLFLSHASSGEGLWSLPPPPRVLVPSWRLHPHDFVRICPPPEAPPPSPSHWGRAAGHELGRWGLGVGTQTLSAWQTRTDRRPCAPDGSAAQQ